MGVESKSRIYQVRFLYCAQLTLSIKNKSMKTWTKSPTKQIADEFGNLIIIKGVARPYIYLRLKSENYARKIGSINKSKRYLKIKRDRSKHLHHITMSYGFNYKILEQAKTFDSIMVIDEHDAFLIPKSEILENGKFINYKTAGFELQIFYRLELMEKFKLKRPTK